MRFSCKAILTGFAKADGTQGVCIQAIINRKRVLFPLGFHVPPDKFSGGKIKSSYPNSYLLNLEIGKAVGRAHEIASEYRLSDRILNTDLFRMEFLNPINKSSFLDFARQELELRKSRIDFRTYQQNKFTLDKLQSFMPKISFSDLSIELVQKYQAFEAGEKYGNADNTINKTLSTWKLYLNAAKRKGIRFNNPFEHIRMSKVTPHKVALTRDELITLVRYFQHPECKDTHRHLLRYFLFSCANGIRVSDIVKLRWEHISNNLITIMPHKTRRKLKTIKIPISDFELSLLPPYDEKSKTVFDCYAAAVSNRYLKEIAKSEHCKIKKKLTYHISRHTFATLFLEQGGRIEVLQDLMGHSEISTTMIYTHISDKRKMEQKKEAFDRIIPEEVQDCNSQLKLAD